MEDTKINLKVILVWFCLVQGNTFSPWIFGDVVYMKMHARKWVRLKQEPYLRDTENFINSINLVGTQYIDLISF